MDWTEHSSIPFIDEQGGIYLLLVSPPPVVQAILKLAELRPGEMLYDLGCGDGRVTIAAAKECGALGLGIELNEDLCAMARRTVEAEGLQEAIEIVQGDLRETEMAAADVVTVYLDRYDLVGGLLQRLRDKILAGGRIISVDGTLAGMEPRRAVAVECGGHAYMLYRYGGCVAGRSPRGGQENAPDRGSGGT